VLHAAESIVAWVLALSITLGLIVLLVWVLRVILRETAGNAARRTLLLTGVAIALFVLWAASRVVP
jgi:hypothetical protein